MKKRMMAVFMTVSLFFSLLVFSAGAAESVSGDVTGDGRVTIRDVAAIRQYLAGGLVLTEEQQAAGDVTGDGRVTIRDVAALRLYLAGKISLEPEVKTDLSLYTIVYPSEYTKYEMYAAELLSDFVEDAFDIVLPMTDDTAAETEYEFLIGDTNRAASDTGVSLEGEEYLLQSVDKQVVLQGADYMIGGAVGALTYQYMKDGAVINSGISAAADPAVYTPLPATGVILMIGDGMGYNHIAAANLQFGLRDETWNGFDAQKLPHQGSVSTYCLDGKLLPTENVFQKTITDSAASGTAMATGWKTYSTYLGVNYLGEPLLNVREVASDLGYKTGILTTDEAFKATPAAFTVHNTSRYDYTGIEAAQQALLDSGELAYLRGEVGDDLLTCTKEVLDTVSTDSDGFFVMIEEAYIDILSVPGKSVMELLQAVARLDGAVEYAMTFAAAHPDTVLIVTADHETGDLSELGNVTNNGAHTMKDVPIFAMGEGTEFFEDRRIENNEIGQFIASVYGVDDFGGVYTNMADE